MSAMYTRIRHDYMPPKTYGYQKVNSADMSQIISRLQRPTLTTDAQHQDLYHTGGAPFRPKQTSLCHKAPSNVDLAMLQQVSRRTVSPKMISKIVRRLQRPTISRMAAEGSISPGYELNLPNTRPPSTGRPQTAKDMVKHVDRVRRPTTASQSKRYHECRLCEDLEKSCFISVRCSPNKKKQEQNIVKKVSPGDLQSIIDKVRSPSFSINGRKSRYLQEYGGDGMAIDAVGFEQTIPLLSGMPKSRDDEDFTTRLSAREQTYEVPLFSKRAPVATPYTVYS